MKRREFEETANILGGKFKAGVWGVKAPVISGRLPKGKYTITLLERWSNLWLAWAGSTWRCRHA
jgi:hypothetical protein